MDKKNRTTRLAQHRLPQFQDNLCTNVRQSAVTLLWAVGCTAFRICINGQSLPFAHLALTINYRVVLLTALLPLLRIRGR